MIHCFARPEHQIKYAEPAILLSASSKLVIWEDARKSTALSSTVHAGQAVYVEGTAKSTSVGGDKLVWEDVDDSQIHTFTNIFTVLSQRIFGDLNFARG